jgi:maltose/moltooligosaccharide transporter
LAGPLVKYVYNDNAIFALVTSGVSFLIAASSSVKDVDDVIKQIMNTKAFIFDLDG